MAYPSRLPLEPPNNGIKCAVTAAEFYHTSTKERAMLALAGFSVVEDHATYVIVDPKGALLGRYMRRDQAYFDAWHTLQERLEVFGAPA